VSLSPSSGFARRQRMRTGELATLHLQNAASTALRSVASEFDATPRVNA
jgi:hypothetical protein